MTKVFVVCQGVAPENQYFSLKVGADVGAPGGGWSPEIGPALQFVREQDAVLFKRYYLSREPGAIVLGIDA